MRCSGRRSDTDRRSPQMRSDIVPGATFPDYELPDHTNIVRRLSELQGDDPLILTLARGHFCPKEHQQHLQLAAARPAPRPTRTARSPPDLLEVAPRPGAARARARRSDRSRRGGTLRSNTFLVTLARRRSGYRRLGLTG